MNLKTEEKLFHKKSIPAASKPRDTIDLDLALGEKLLKIKDGKVRLSYISHEMVRSLCAKGKLNPILTYLFRTK